jgi:hypothetical protein
MRRKFFSLGRVMDYQSNLKSFRHCERSEAIQLG